YRKLRRVLRALDRSEGVLVFLDIVFQGQNEPFGVFGGDDDARLDLGFGHTRHEPDKVDYEFAVRMGDHRQVRVYAFRDLFRQFDVDLRLLFFLLVSHKIGVKTMCDPVVAHRVLLSILYQSWSSRSRSRVRASAAIMASYSSLWVTIRSLNLRCPVPAGIRWPTITFSFRPFSMSVL